MARDARKTMKREIWKTKSIRKLSNVATTIKLFNFLYMEKDILLSKT